MPAYDPPLDRLFALDPPPGRGSAPLAHLDENDDYARDELSKVLGMLGPTVLPALAAFLGRRDVGPLERGVAAEAVARLAGGHPDTRDECVSVLAGARGRAAGRVGARA